MKINKNIPARIVKNSCILVAMFAIAQYVFAVSGIRIKSGEKERNTETRHTSGVFSDLKSTVTFSIKDNYTFNNKNYGKTDFKSSEQPKPASSIISYKKGNTIYILPYKPQPGLKLPGFISMSPSEPVSR
ncbi:hypothetical protein [Agriterribacter sp.]|uniref:hypothetical protein n=1 Tax=Agriterribacter sp. TaxID=2821509 RepID=UPI002BF1A8EE|nr:hypothetical protein [Agriterribacter sp.]HTN09025.1 hypothetical protein [Agriterribacter sp.]